MDSERLDQLSRAAARILPRRAVASILGASALALPGLVEAGKKKRKRRKRKKAVKRNAFGCVNVGSVCTRDGQCCSGICAGKQGRKRCQAHGSGKCQAGQDICTGMPVPCTTGTGDDGFCLRTTGDAGYCSFSGRCMTPACRKDADCHDVCGPQAACIICEGDCHSGPTVCVGPGVGSCIQP